MTKNKADVFWGYFLFCFIFSFIFFIFLSSGLLLNEDDEGTGKDGQNFEDRLLPGKGYADSAAEKLSTDVTKAFNAKDSTQADLDDCVLRCKSVFKCRLCPRIVCLTEDTLRAHLYSKVSLICGR